MRRAVLLRPHLNLMKGEVAGFDEAEFARLVEAGIVADADAIEAAARAAAEAEAARVAAEAEAARAAAEAGAEEKAGKARK